MSDLDAFSPAELEELKNNPEIRKLILGDDDYDEGMQDVVGQNARDNLLKFFRDVLALKNSEHDRIARTGNLTSGEIGWLSLPVRNYFSLANYLETESFPKVADYFRSKAIVTINTSLGRKAKLLELVVTQKNVKRNIMPKTIETKSGMFGSTTTESGGEEDS